jgi:small-conductance mechanosensitive channel
VRRLHRTLDHVQVPIQPLTQKLTPDFRVAVATGAVAMAALIAASTFGNIHGPDLRHRVIAGSCAGGFVILAVYASRSVGNEFARLLEARTGRAHAGVVRLLITLAGYALVLVTALSVLAVPVQHLLLGGALTGVIIGIAAQQALSNLFAGLVLLLARPFNVGDDIRIRAGSLGGVLDGHVVGMGMTYVTLDMADGPISVPNGTLLAAAIGPQPNEQDDTSNLAA